MGRGKRDAGSGGPPCARLDLMRGVELRHQSARSIRRFDLVFARESLGEFVVRAQRAGMVTISNEQLEQMAQVAIVIWLE
ncbi:MAG TPA: hypothetical protein VF962_07730 [Gemmatimonadaceae bacterium]